MFLKLMERIYRGKVGQWGHVISFINCTIQEEKYSLFFQALHTMVSFQFYQIFIQTKGPKDLSDTVVTAMAIHQL